MLVFDYAFPAGEKPSTPPKLHGRIRCLEPREEIVEFVELVQDPDLSRIRPHSKKAELTAVRLDGLDLAGCNAPLSKNAYEFYLSAFRRSDGVWDRQDHVPIPAYHAQPEGADYPRHTVAIMRLKKVGCQQNADQGEKDEHAEDDDLQNWLRVQAVYPVSRHRHSRG